MSLATERRLTTEWALLQRLAAQNPQRLVDLQAEDLTFYLQLKGTPALPLSSGAGDVRSDHHVRIIFPRFYPTTPLELYLQTPVQHPNIHPQTGFVCLWDRHRVGHTVEHALHKLVAILGWRLYNRDAVHIMQPAALARLETSREAIAASLAAPLLAGTTLGDSWPGSQDALRRRRLS